MRPLLPFLLLVAACGAAPAAPTTTQPPAAVDPFTAPSLPGAGPPMAATVTRVLDGDSMEVSIGGDRDELRLLGINAPEGDECLGDESRRAMRDAVEGRDVTVYGSERDQFDRLLGYIEVDGTAVGWLQVRRGLALALSVPHPRLVAYGQAEDDAFVEEIGIWAIDACGPPTRAILGIDEVGYDPPGPDGDNRTEEFVRITNADDPVDMTGWVLRDESTRWRYSFPDGYLLEDEVTVRTGCGRDDADDVYWCADDPVWSNAGDTVLLLDPSGNVVARVAYGAKTQR